MSTDKPVIIWFRQDLRLNDNPALMAAADSDGPLLPIYILDDASAGEWAMGGASRWWLHQSLQALNESLDGQLRVFTGSAEKLLPEIARECGATEVYWNRCYEPWRVARDTAIKSALQAAKLFVKTYNGSLLFEPQHVKKADGTPYRVFTPFYRRGCLENHPPPREPLAAPTDLRFSTQPMGDSVDALQLMPTINWYSQIAAEWQPGERGATTRLQDFLADGVSDYRAGRNRPDQRNVSRLSPHLHFGEISPHQVWQATVPLIDDAELHDEVDHFRSELGWREFSHSLLFHWPDITRRNLQRKFDRFPWNKDDKLLQSWQQGMTGYPIVDAGMRELWQTGYMHNRVRMIVGSFLVKNLLLHWHHGEDWFWDTLLDADLANNSASWQWIAGCGADAAPYFRIFNPVTQGQRFDPNGDYVREYVPELKALPNKLIHSPWLADEALLGDANVILGETYPHPIVELKASRERALQAFKDLRNPLAD